MISYLVEVLLAPQVMQPLDAPFLVLCPLDSSDSCFDFTWAGSGEEWKILSCFVVMLPAHRIQEAA
jgi:hypothetical protein